MKHTVEQITASKSGKNSNLLSELGAKKNHPKKIPSKKSSENSYYKS